MMSLTAINSKIISVLCRDLPENFAPFEKIAAGLGVSEEELFGKLGQFRRSRLLRRFGASVDHKRIGFGASAMVLWRVPEKKVENAAKKVVSYSAVTHCYERKTCPGWPYNLYAMVHGKTREQCERLAAEITRTIASEEYRLLFTVREFKKVSPEYFSAESGR